MESLDNLTEGLGEDRLSIDAEEIEQLHEAVEEGDLNKVRDTLRKQKKGQYFHLVGKHALFVALNDEKPEIVLLLIEYGAKIYPHKFHENQGKNLINGKHDWKILHYFAFQRDLLVDNLLNFCNSHLGKNSLKEMLMAADVNGKNVIHLLVSKNSYDILIRNLKFIQEFLGNYFHFQDILKSTGQNHWNILHYFAFHKDHSLGNLLNFCESHLGKNCLKEMIMAADVNGEKVIHLLVRKNSYEVLIKNLKFIQEFLGNYFHFKDILTSTGQNNWNILHYFAFHRDLPLDKLLDFCESPLGKNSLKEMIMAVDVNGKNVIHLLESKKSNDIKKKNLKFVREFVGNYF